MSKMSKHERVIRLRIEMLDESISGLMASYDHYKTQLEQARDEQVLLHGLLKDAEENGSTPAAEEDEETRMGTPKMAYPLWEVPAPGEKKDDVT